MILNFNTSDPVSVYSSAIYQTKQCYHVLENAEEVNVKMNKIEPVDDKDLDEMPDDINMQRLCLKQILFAMKVSGCYTTKSKEVSTGIHVIFNVLSVIYRCFIFCIILFGFCKGLSNFTSIEAETMPGNAIVTVWMGSSLVTFILCQKANSRRFGHQDEAFEMFNQQLISTMQKWI